MSYKKPLYQELACAIDAYFRCEEHDNKEWMKKHQEHIQELCEDHLPHGSGFDDDGVHLDFDRSTGEKLVFYTAYHHMDENGMYDGWTNHDIIVKPSLRFGYETRITGKDYHDIKEYMYEVIGSALSELIECGAPEANISSEETKIPEGYEICPNPIYTITIQNIV